jgi:N-acetylglucosaminyl-diphospho-decaprenol L-rhamnosyltransferase
MGLIAATLVRAVRHGRATAVARGLIDALRGLPAVWAARRAIQSRRRASVAEIAAALVWSPAKMHQRAIVLRALQPESPQPTHGSDLACTERS